MNLWLVTGWRGNGKTTFCREIALAARAMGWDAAGLLSKGVFRDGVKESIWAEDVRSGEKQLLATTRPQLENDLNFGDWHFNRKTLEWGNQVLKSCVPCDLLVVDELGPLEFKLSLGWISALEVIQSGRFRLALVVVRPELIEAAQSHFSPVLTIQMNSVNEVNSKVQQYTPLLLQLLKT